jgi:hypothetical protein
MNRKEVIFVEGVNGAGKDYFLDHVHQYFPKSTIYYAPKDNVEHADWCEAAYITYNTILRSIDKDSSSNTSFVYRSPLTDFVYNKFYNREISAEKEIMLVKLLEAFFEKYLCTILYLEPEDDLIKIRRPQMTFENIKALKKLYGIFLYKIQSVNYTRMTLSSFDAFIKKLDTQISDLPARAKLFMDVDDTLIQYPYSYRKSWPDKPCECIGLFTPPENLPITFISGREHSFPSILSPYPNAFKSSYNYKYAFFKRMIELDKKFIWYDDYFTIQAQLADEYSQLDFRLVNAGQPHRLIGRLEKCD